MGCLKLPYLSADRHDREEKPTQLKVSWKRNGEENPSKGVENFLYNGKELQEDLGLDLYDYGARFYDPAIARFISIDPASDNYHSWTPYHYVMNNPILFVDPTGMFTELFDQDGNKIGADKNGNDGNVSIITNNDDASRIKSDYENGGVASAEDVSSGVQTTKATLSESLNVLKRTGKNGGLKEEVSLVMNDGEVVQGATGPKPKIENGIQTAETQVPSLPNGKTDSDVNALIHSHPTKIVEQDGLAFPQSASKPSEADNTTFGRFKTNIIVGKIGELNTVQKSNSGTLIDPRKSGAVINQRGKSPTELTRKSLKRIIKN